MSPIEETERWLENIVIGLGICPFAKSVFDAKSIRYQVCEPVSASDLLLELIEECQHLDEHETTATTLLIYPEGLDSFEDYLDVVAAACDQLETADYGGIYQLASFHPAYVFDGCDDDDAANLTNRSPFPTLHLIREAGMSEALASYPSPEKIPERNMRICRELGHEGLRAVLLGGKV
ncbi:MAG: DUF1415 domain-containing protein [Myxococcales bacterium]|nr:DUF1415 domain-containing protein [Myxococcales bacterium]